MTHTLKTDQIVPRTARSKRFANFRSKAGTLNALSQSMTQRQATADKTWLPTETHVTPVAGIITKFLNFVKRQIPEGYQDETGFHFGAKPAEEHPSWPPA